MVSFTFHILVRRERANLELTAQVAQAYTGINNNKLLIIVNRLMLFWRASHKRKEDVSSLLVWLTSEGEIRVKSHFIGLFVSANHVAKGGDL